jgi:hypothetical protein
VKEVQGDRFHGEFSEGESHIDDIFAGLAHSDDATAAELQAGFTNVLEGFESIFEGMGRADFFVVVLAGIEVVVDFIDAGGRKPLGLGFAQ